VGSYQAGAAVRDITPSSALLEAGRIWLWGYGNRDTPCKQVLEPIDARALVVCDDSGNSIVLVSIDIGALDPTMTAAVKARVAAAYNGLSAEYVCVNASHTHGAPVVVSIPTWQLGVGRVDPDYVSFVEDQIVAVIDDAFNRLQPANLSWARGTTYIGHDRHFDPRGDGNGYYDSTLDVVRVSDDTDAVISVIFCAACHPVCLGSTNKVYSDFPGGARNLIETQFGGVGLFFQGYAGTCNPGTREDEATDEGAIGQRLASDVANILRGSMDDLEGPLDAWLRVIDLPFQPLDLATLPQWRDYARANPGGVGDLGPLMERWVTHMESFGANIPETLPTQLQAIRIGVAPKAWYLVASSHEVSMDFAPTIRSIWPYPRITVVGYSNAQLSYLPSSLVLLNPDDRGNFPKALANYEGGTSFLWYGHRGPLTIEVDSLFIKGHIDVLDPSWSVMGDAADVVAMTACNGKLFAATANNILWCRDPVDENIPWTNIGHAMGVVGMAAINGMLFCATGEGKLWQRSTYGFDVPWEKIGLADEVAAMTTINGKLVAATKNGRLWWRDPVVGDIAWENIGHSIGVLGLAAAGGVLVAATIDNNLHWRAPLAGEDVGWRHYGYAQDVVGMASIDETLFVATKEGKLWRRPL
jgi:hypothetical protein